MDATSQRDKLRQAAKAIGELCTELNLHIINLQPCRNYDGIIDQAEHEQAVEEITFKMEVGRRAVSPTTAASDAKTLTAAL